MRKGLMMVLVCATALSPTVLAQTGQAGRSATPQTAKPAPPAPAAAAQNSVNVTVKYTGKGVVDTTHDIVVVLLPGPTVNPNSEPISMQSVTKNGGVATFSNVTTAPVYVLAIYDDKGTWNQQQGPPPAGTPMGWYMLPKTTAPAAVTPGPKGVAVLTFDGSKKFGQ